MQQSGSPMKLRAFIPTVGEKVLEECVTKLFQTVRGLEFTIWWDQCGRLYDHGFDFMVRSITDDLIILQEQHGLTGSIGWALTYLDYDFLIYCTPDMLVYPGWFERAMAYFDDPTVAIVGEAWRPALGKEAAINDRDRGIDGISIFRKQAVNAVGSMSPAFNGRGPFHTEWHRRAAKLGWKYIAIDGLCQHGGKQHEGRDLDQNWQNDLHKDNLTYLEMDRKDYIGYNWWGNETTGEKSKG